MRFQESGFEIIRNVLDADSLATILADLDKLKLKPQQAGIRRINHLSVETAELTKSPLILNLIANFLQSRPQLVRAIYFDKSPEHNWYVTWHQDRTVSISGRFEADGWGPWSLKAGIWHVQPPLDVLRQMATIRIHLDEARQANGCLKVIPGSHRQGIIPTGEVAAQVSSEDVIYCEVNAGDAVLMFPHILHASEKSLSLAPRRVLHFEYTAWRLPAGITWMP